MRKVLAWKALLITKKIDTEHRKIYNNVIDDISDGSIILLHDHYLSTVQALELIIPELQEEGYKIVNITELFSLKNITLENNKVYRSAK